MSKNRSLSDRLGKKRRFTLLCLTICTVFFVWAAHLWFTQQQQLAVIAQQRATLQQQLQTERANRTYYATQKKNLGDAEYIEQTVRKQFGMHRIEDRLFEE